jgi:hypothetical protein
MRSRHRACAPEMASVERRDLDRQARVITVAPVFSGPPRFLSERRMGTSLAMIDATYGHLAPAAEEQEAALLDAFDERCRSLLDTGVRL